MDVVVVLVLSVPSCLEVDVSSYCTVTPEVSLFLH